MESMILFARQITCIGPMSVIALGVIGGAIMTRQATLIEHLNEENKELKQRNALLSKQAASMSNDLAAYVSKMNSLSRYILENRNSTSEARAYAEDVLDFAVPRLESEY